MSTQTMIMKAVLAAAVSLATASASRGAGDPRRLSETTDIHHIAHQFNLPRPRLTAGRAALDTPIGPLVFYPNSRKLECNNTLIWLNGPTMISRSRWIVSDHDLQHTIAPLLRPRMHLPPADTPLVVLDAGHGGSDPGAVGPRGLYEKEITLDICRRTAMHLRNAGIRSALTRKTDQALSLRQRPEMARRLGATVFVSVHANSSSTPSSTGFETYLLSAAGFPSTAPGSRPGAASPGNQFDAASLLLAYAVHRAVVPATGVPDRGIRRARFAVLRQAQCPAILLETGFISNPAEEARLATAAYRETLAMAIAQGLVQHFRQRTFLPAPYLAQDGTAATQNLAPSTHSEAPSRSPAAENGPTVFAVQPTRAAERRR